MSVTDTSIESYKDLDNQKQALLMAALYKKANSGYADFEMQELLRNKYGIKIPKSSVSARRNDVNKLFGNNYVHDKGLRIRDQSTNRRCIVWMH